MPYTLTVANEERRDVVVDALRTAAERRTKVATMAAGNLAEDKAAGKIKDARGPAVRVAMLLAEANYLTTAADELAAAKEGAGLLVAGPSIAAPAVVEAPPGVDPAVLAAAMAAAGDDGTSPEAQRIAALAGLQPSGPDDEDPLTGELPEDRIDEVADVAALGALDPITDQEASTS